VRRPAHPGGHDGQQRHHGRDHLDQEAGTGLVAAARGAGFARDQRWDIENAPTIDKALRLAQQRADLLTALLGNDSERSTKME